ncbi:GlcG [Bosea sp. WAO]|uniref:GlcG/HbpS family heme-binding protein n=1 Tax=Bosea sp. WAO TaxID=406341 RepID=UPI000746EE16|nr:heme-binding protein [Bosea sp. WAO]KUL93063.1 GlcG [Bosea sp. WAO]
MSVARLVLISAAVALPTLAQAQVPQERVLPSALAVELAQATVAACAAKNFNVTATVVDRQGVVRATVRADRAGPHTLEASRAKAFTSASARSNTGAMAEAAANNAGARNLVHIPGFLLLGGGVPVKVGDDVVGAVGVGGAPGGHLDEECANAGLQAIAAKLK